MAAGAQEDAAEKSHEPTERRLQEARRKGEIPRSPDLLTTMAYAGLLAALAFLGPGIAGDFGSALVPFLDSPDQLVESIFRDGATAPTGRILVASLLPVMAVFLVPTTLVVAALLATRGLVFAPDKLKPKLQRLSPIENAKNKYGRRGLFEFAKSFSKLAIYATCLVLFLRQQSESILVSPATSPQAVAVALGVKLVGFLSIVVPVAAAIGWVDFMWQRADHMRQNRMSLKELRDEIKESEGDPHVKHQRRARGQEIALSRMLQDVPKADVVIVNPTHYAVALKWSRAPGSAPVCVALGRDLAALRIREIAEGAGVPIHSDPPTARALHASVRVGEQIAVEHYRAVAAAIRFADAMREKARREWRR